MYGKPAMTRYSQLKICANVLWMQLTTVSVLHSHIQTEDKNKYYRGYFLVQEDY